MSEIAAMFRAQITKQEQEWDQLERQHMAMLRNNSKLYDEKIAKGEIRQTWKGRLHMLVHHGHGRITYPYGYDKFIQSVSK